MNTLAGTLVLVLGLGESGLAMARWCAHAGARLRVADSRDAPPGLDALRRRLPEAEVVLGEFDVALLEGVGLVAVSPGLDFNGLLLQSARDRGLTVVGEMTLFAEALETLNARRATRVVAITGTNGKTTTTALTAALIGATGLDTVAAGNISPAALDVLLERIEQDRSLPECWVLELSSFQLESMEGLVADAATVLNLSDDHLDRHGDMASYARIKARIFAGEGVQVLNRSDALVAAMSLPGREVIWFGSDRASGDKDFGLLDDNGTSWLACGGETLLDTSRMKIAGRHNAMNALAALALGRAIGCPIGRMLEALSRFTVLPHRMELVARRRDGVCYYNDSKGTNVGATVAALEGLDRPAVLIAGGDGKGQDFSPLREPLSRRGRAVVLIGRDALHIADALAGLDLPVRRSETLQLAVREADGLARPGDAVLLSPACASLDMFRNYADRGRQFVDAVLQLAEVSPA